MDKVSSSSGGDGDKGKVMGMFENMSKVLIPFILMFVGWQNSQIQLLDERLFSLQKEFVTEYKLQEVERRISSYIDTRIGDLSQKIDTTNRYLELLVNNSNKNKKE